MLNAITNNNQMPSITSHATCIDEWMTGENTFQCYKMKQALLFKFIVECNLKKPINYLKYMHVKPIKYNISSISEV